MSYMKIHYKESQPDLGTVFGPEGMWMGHEIISTNLGGPSNISCANGWARNKYTQLFRMKTVQNKIY